MADLSDISATVDIYCIDDFLPDMPVVTGRTALAHRLARRLQTPRGRFPWWPNFGTDLRQYLLSKAKPTAIASAAEAECLKDEQVEDVTCFVEVLNGGRSMRVVIQITDADGPFVFTLEISQAAETLLDLQAA